MAEWVGKGVRGFVNKGGGRIVFGLGVVSAGCAAIIPDPLAYCSILLYYA